MPTSYTTADASVASVVKDAATRWYPDLREAKVSFDLLFAVASELGEPALKKNGVPALAIIKVNSLEDRAKGMNDATIKIDGAKWGEMRETERLSLIDHELYHLVVVRSKKSKAIKRDDLGRPKLKLRPHDFEIGGFAEIIERHKQNAHEAMAVYAATTNYCQGVFPWG